MKCSECGKSTFIHYGGAEDPLCKKCLSILKKTEFSPRKNTIKNKNVERQLYEAPMPWMGVLGIFLLIVGLYFLLLDPSMPSSAGIVNIQKLSIGQTMSVVGAIFIGFQWRPR